MWARRSPNVLWPGGPLCGKDREVDYGYWRKGKPVLILEKPRASLSHSSWTQASLPGSGLSAWSGQTVPFQEGWTSPRDSRFPEGSQILLNPSGGYFHNLLPISHTCVTWVYDFLRNNILFKEGVYKRIVSVDFMLCYVEILQANCKLYYRNYFSIIFRLCQRAIFYALTLTELSPWEGNFG